MLTEGPFPEDLLASINRRLLLVQEFCLTKADERPQPLAVEEAEQVWLGWSELVRGVRADLARLRLHQGDGGDHAPQLAVDRTGRTPPGKR